jgi:hypothetical protein
MDQIGGSIQVYFVGGNKFNPEDGSSRDDFFYFTFDKQKAIKHHDSIDWRNYGAHCVFSIRMHKKFKGVFMECPTRDQVGGGDSIYLLLELYSGDDVIYDSLFGWSMTKERLINYVMNFNNADDYYRFRIVKVTLDKEYKADEVYTLPMIHRD